MDLSLLESNNRVSCEAAPRPTVLLVDDEEAAREAMRKLLEERYCVLTSGNGLDALDVVRRNEVDLIVLDINMPELDGYETCGELKAFEGTRHLPVIFMTACDSLEAELAGLGRGAVDYLTKPCAPKRFLARVESHLSSMEERRSLMRRSSQDELTGLANRHAVSAALEREWQAALRFGTPLSLILLDIDNFKQVNDRHGHSAGDACLRRVAAAIASQVQRPHDLVARFGGEEFLVMLPHTGLYGARNTAESIREAVEALEPQEPAESGVSEPLVTVSAGVACHFPRWVEGVPDTHYTSLIDLADRHLYRAKSLGKNRVFGIEASL